MSAAGNWCLIESDPGVFTELIRGFGVTGIQVEELYSLDSGSFNALKPIHGLIFLFKWIGNSEVDGKIVNDSRIEQIVFMKQVIENSCATQAILSVLLNCIHPDVDLGATLTEFKQFVSVLDPETRGLALTNSDTIRGVHNSFARQALFELDEKTPSKEEDAFHFVAYLPINGTLYELDGLKEGPIDLGPISPGIDWTEVCKPILEKRIARYSEGEIHFNLMALVTDRKMIYQRELNLLNQANIIQHSEQWFRMKELENLIDDEDRKRLAYRKENVRRKHNYIPLIIEILKILAEQGALEKLVNQASEVNKKRTRKQIKK